MRLSFFIEGIGDDIMINNEQVVKLARTQLITHISESYDINVSFFEEVEMSKARNLHLIIEGKMQSDIIVNVSTPFQEDLFKKALDRMKSLFSEDNVLFTPYLPCGEKQVDKTKLYLSFPFMYKLSTDKAFSMLEVFAKGDFDNVLLTNETLDTILHIYKEGEKVWFSFYEKEE